jgi:hypothetical protein
MTILARDFTDAFYRDPESYIVTPGWSKPRARILDIVADEISGDEATLLPLLLLVRSAAHGDDVKQDAQAWIASAANEFADWHADDLCADANDGK